MRKRRNLDRKKAIATERGMHPAVQRELKGQVRKWITLNRTAYLLEQSLQTQPEIILTDDQPT